MSKDKDRNQNQIDVVYGDNEATRLARSLAGFEPIASLRGTSEYNKLFDRLSLAGPVGVSLSDLMKNISPKDLKIIKTALDNQKKSGK